MVHRKSSFVMLLFVLIMIFIMQSSKVIAKIDYSTLAYEGKDYKVELSFSSEANISKDATLKVTEFYEGSKEYQEYFSQTDKFIKENTESVVSYARFFDVCIVENNKEIEPLDTVEVSIICENGIDKGEENTLSVIHFVEDGTKELLEIKNEKVTEEVISEITFEQDSFSVIGMIVFDGADTGVKEVYSNQISKTNMIDIRKEWSDGNNIHENDEVTISLYQDNSKQLVYYDEIILNHDNNWKGQFKNLDKSKEYVLKETNISTDNKKSKIVYESVIENTSVKKWCPKEKNQMEDGDTVVLIFGEENTQLLRKSSYKSEVNLRTKNVTIVDDPDYGKYCETDIAIYEMWDCIWNNKQEAWELYHPDGKKYLSLKYNSENECYEWATSTEKTEGSYLNFEDGKISASLNGVTKYIGNISGNGPYKALDESDEGITIFQLYTYNIFNPGNFVIHNIKNESSQEEQVDAGIITGKNIDYLGDGEKNNDTDVDDKGLSEKILKDLYRLNLNLEMKTDSTGLDLLMVIDVSSSMKTSQDCYDETENMIFRFEALKQALNRFVPEFLPKESKNRLSIVAFESESIILQDWTNDYEEVLEKINYEVDGEFPLYNGEGTNYETALVRAHEALAKCGYSNNAKAMIFLSDGDPTAYLMGNDSIEKGNVTVNFGNATLSDVGIEGVLPEGMNIIFTSGFGEKLKESTYEAIQSFKSHNSEIMVGTIAFNTKITDYLKNLATREEFVVAIEKGTPSDLINAMELITNFVPEKIVVTDELSENVELYEDDPDIKVSMTDKQESTIELYNDKHGLTETGKLILSEKYPIEVDGNRLILNFREDYEVQNGHIYNLSFNVAASQKAYDKYADAEGKYSDKGDENTDFEGNKTSSLREGFYSNGDNTKVSYLMNGVTIEKKYDKPVIQADDTSLAVKKVNFKGETISEGAEFAIYRKADFGEIDTENLKGVDGKYKKIAKAITDENGQILFEHLRISVFDSGYPYYIVETKSPEGYAKLENPIKINLFKENVEIEEENELIAIGQRQLRENEKVGELTITNKEYVDFSFTKVAAENNQQKLTGAVFEIWMLACDDGVHDHVNECFKLIETVESEPEVKLHTLITGNTYKLVEVKAPDGFVKPDGYWEITVNTNKEISIEEVGKLPNLKEVDEGVYVLDNTKAIDIPITGGEGNFKYYFIGIALIIGGIIMKKKSLNILMMFMAVIVGCHLICSTAFAIGNTDRGSITVNNVENAVSVSAYRLMDINYDYNVDQPKNPMYKWVNEVAEWMSTNYPEYIDEDNQNAVNESFSEAKEVIVAEIYDKLAVAIKDGTVNLDGSIVLANGESVVVDNLTMGNYFILIEGGAKVYRPLTANVVPEWKNNVWEMSCPSVSAKATSPTITKTVTSGLTADNVNIGDTVSYELNAVIPTYPVNAIAKKYMVSDKLSEGLTLVNDSIKVYGVNSGKEEVELQNVYTKLENRIVENEDKKATFTLDFDYSLISGYESLKITYDAVLNEKAKVGETGNTNIAFLDYNNNPYVTESWNTDSDETVVYTYGMRIFKVDEDTNSGLSGAEFTLSKDGQEIHFVGENGTYHVAGLGETGNTIVTVDKGGLLTLKGLDAGTYALEEVKAPDGYVKLQNPVEVVITDENMNGKVESGEGELADGYMPVTVKNDTGFTLPVTGGMGTTLFNVAGVVLMGSGLLLIVAYIRKRRNSR